LNIKTLPPVDACQPEIPFSHDDLFVRVCVVRHSGHTKTPLGHTSY
jgi:hypothetical protein